MKGSGCGGNILAVAQRRKRMLQKPDRETVESECGEMARPPSQPCGLTVCCPPSGRQAVPKTFGGLRAANRVF